MVSKHIDSLRMKSGCQKCGNSLNWENLEFAWRQGSSGPIQISLTTIICPDCSMKNGSSHGREGYPCTAYFQVSSILSGPIRMTSTAAAQFGVVSSALSLAYGAFEVIRRLIKVFSFPIRLSIE